MAQDVTFSIPHRLLAILIRRKMLSDHTTAASFLSGTEQRIAIKQSALSLPVVCADKIAGRGLDERRAIFASDISAFFQRRVVAFGLPPNVTPYAWRHPFAANASGESKDAREISQQNDVAVKSLILDGALNPAEDSAGDDETIAAMASSSRMFLEFLVNE
ncbi:hypothetical protein B9Z65_3134 [Elsinoe australis]|uniref:Uncharacterized protein n=1 Tax=Elsinoe australis TaxID=40998 RepID=A0A2P7ZUI6_9PEZI|nr:hypothetical protein B9Z65_3134 [Elsinoe australis]